MVNGGDMRMSSKESSKFKYISENTSEITNALLLNQNLIRYIHYLDNKHPLDKHNPDVSPRRVRDKNFIFTHFNEEILVDTQILVFLNPIMNDFRSTTLSNDTYSLEVVIPYRYWIIKTDDGFKLRAYEIAHEIAKTIDHQRITGIGDIEIIQSRSGKINDRFSVISLVVLVKNSSMQSSR